MTRFDRFNRDTQTPTVGGIMNKIIQTTCLIVIAISAVILFVLAIGEAAVMPAAIASNIADVIDAAPEADRFSVAYDSLHSHLDGHFLRLKLLGVIIFACAAICLYMQFSHFNTVKGEQPVFDVPASQKSR
jgi:hypothetical protein